MFGFLKRVLGFHKSDLRPHQHRQKTYKENADILSGERFSATLNLYTPLRYLELHDSLVPTGKAPEPDEAEYGVWLPEIDAQYKIPGFDSDEMTSAFGPVPSDGGSLLPLLKNVRRIVEQPVDQAQVLQIARQRVEPVMAAVGEQSEFELFASEDDCLKLLVQEYVGSIKYLSGHHYRALIDDFGCESIADLTNLSDQQLLSLSGIGPAKLKVLRSEFENLQAH